MRLFRYHPNTGWRGSTFDWIDRPFKVSNPYNANPKLPNLKRKSRFILTVASYMEDIKGKQIKLSKPALFCLGIADDCHDENDPIWHWVAYVPYAFCKKRGWTDL